MRQISKSEVDSLIRLAGFVCFMGGVSTDSEQVIYQVGNEFYLFDRWEINKPTDEYLKVCKLQEQESKDYSDSIFKSS